MPGRIARLPVLAHVGATVLAFGAFQWVKGRLDASYAASGHPVDYATGQLAFDARTIEGHYAAMIEAGTLDIYVRTQVIDFGFIACVMALSLLLGTLVARLGGPGSFGWRAGMAAAVLGVAGATMDVVENLLSFVMLARPQDIPQALALAYSSAAAAKFVLLTLAMLAVGVSLVAGAAARLRRRFA